MRKIPTLFVRDPDDRRHVLPAVTPGCEWVLAGEGCPTRKLDGTCVMHDEHGAWWARREVKPGKDIPRCFVTVQHDEATGKLVGWEPIAQSPFAKFHAEALEAADTRVADPGTPWTAGTYELIGPKINGNPERYDRHWLVAHHNTETFHVGALTFEGIRDSVLCWHRADHVEGIVWHHPDGRMAKIKARDFAIPGADKPQVATFRPTATMHVEGTLSGPLSTAGAKALHALAESLQEQSGAPADPDKPCPHEDFDVIVEVNRVTAGDTDPTPIAFHADIKVNCRDCQEPFRWTGVPAGMSPRQPMCSIDETELHAPLRPASADPDFGLGLPGFSVNYRGPKEG